MGDIVIVDANTDYVDIDDDDGPAVGRDDGGSVILWEIPPLHQVSIIQSQRCQC